jgi:hypothetical protein
MLDELLGLLLSVTSFLAGLLPTWDPVDLSGFLDAISCDQFSCGEIGGTEYGGPIFRMFSWANYYVPVAELLAVINLALAFWVFLHGYKLLVWVLVRLHIIGGEAGDPV